MLQSGVRSALPFTFLSVVLVSCGAAEPRVEPASRHTERESQPEAAVEAPPLEAEPQAAARSACIESPEQTVRCESAAVPARTHDALMAALTARVQARRSQGTRAQPRDTLAPRPLDDEELALVSELRADRCALATGDPERARSTYWLARVHYEANHFGPAALLFDEVALDPQSGELAIYAANLALDSLDLALRGTEGATREDCLTRFATAVSRYHAHLCGASTDDEELCRTLATLTAQLAERRR